MKDSPWHQDVFFYLCMEEHALWKKVMGYEYKDNLSFEKSMKEAYRLKIEKISGSADK